MRTRTFGKQGWPVSEIGHGLWGVGGWTGSDDDESITAIRRAADLGCTFFDTALAYGQGKSEQLLGRALGARASSVRIAPVFFTVRSRTMSKSCAQARVATPPSPQLRAKWKAT